MKVTQCCGTCKFGAFPKAIKPDSFAKCIWQPEAWPDSVDYKHKFTNWMLHYQGKRCPCWQPRDQEAR